MLTIADIVKSKARGDVPPVSKQGNPYAQEPEATPRPGGVSEEDYAKYSQYMTPSQLALYTGEENVQGADYLQKLYEAGNTRPEWDEKQQKRREQAALFSDAFGSLARMLSASRGGLVPAPEKTFTEKNREREEGEYNRYLGLLSNYERGRMSAMAGDRDFVERRRSRDEAGVQQGLREARTDARHAGEVQYRKEQDDYQKEKDKQQQANWTATFKANDAQRRKDNEYRDDALKAREVAAKNQPEKGNDSLVEITVPVPGHMRVDGASVGVDGAKVLPVQLTKDEVSRIAKMAREDREFIRANGAWIPKSRDGMAWWSDNERHEVARAYMSYLLDRGGQEALDYLLRKPRAVDDGQIIWSDEIY